MAADELSQTLSALLSNPQTMQTLQGLMGAFANGGGARQAAAPAPETAREAPPPPPQPAAGAGTPAFDPALLLKMQQAMGALRQDDPRMNFLMALKPNLSEHRRQRVDEAIRILRLLSMVPLLREQRLL